MTAEEWKAYCMSQKWQLNSANVSAMWCDLAAVERERDGEKKRHAICIEWAREEQDRAEKAEAERDALRTRAAIAAADRDEAIQKLQDAATRYDLLERLAKNISAERDALREELADYRAYYEVVGVGRTYLVEHPVEHPEIQAIVARIEARGKA